MPLPDSARTGVPNGRFCFDVRIGGSVIRDDVGACALSADDALADAIEAVEAVEELGRKSDLQGGADEIVVRDEDGHEVGRIDLTLVPRLSICHSGIRNPSPNTSAWLGLSKRCFSSSEKRFISGRLTIAPDRRRLTRPESARRRAPGVPDGIRGRQTKACQPA
jgi:hypothetical protein